METEHNIFFDEWRACLRSHYMHVVRIDDTVTEPSLRQVLFEAGFTESEITELYQAALQSDTSLPDQP